MPSFHVSPAAAHELLPACRLLFPTDHAEQNRERILAAREPTQVFVARDSGGKVRAAALVQALPGAAGIAWPTRGDWREAEDAATRAACDWLRGRGVKVCQAFAAEAEIAEMVPLERAGFRRVTQLVMLRRELSPPAARHEPPDQTLSFVEEFPPLSGAFAEALVATHSESRDCPELNLARTGAEILAGFTPSPSATWHLASHNGEPAGVVLLEYGKAAEEAELTYLGLLPAARGRGLGAELLAFATAEAAAFGAPALAVSVDARNAPAMRLYARHGFAECDRREVWLAQL